MTAHAKHSATSARIRALSWKMATLDREIAAEADRPLPDNVRLSALKRMKLRLKDEVRALQTKSPAAHNAHGRWPVRGQEANQAHV